MDKLDELVLKSKGHLGDVNKLIIEYIFNSIDYLLNNQLELAYDMLEHCEEVISSATKQSLLIESEVLCLTSHTYALYYYKYPINSKKEIQNSAIYLFKSIQILKQRPLSPKPLHHILQNRLLCSMHLQLFGLYTSVNNHDLALLHIKEALRKSEEILISCTSICSDHMHRHKNLYTIVTYKQLKHPQYNLQESPHYKLFHQLVVKSLPLLLFIQGKHTEPSKIVTDWVPPVTLNDLYKMQPFDFNILYKAPELLEEFQEESVLYKVNIHASICYLIGETCKRMKWSYQKWVDMACRTARILPREWFICKALARFGIESRSKCRSVNKNEGILAMRKSSFSPNVQGSWKTSTPCNRNNTGKSPFDFSKRLKNRSKYL